MSSNDVTTLRSVDVMNFLLGKFATGKYTESAYLCAKYGKYVGISCIGDVVYINGSEIYKSGVWGFSLPKKWIHELYEYERNEK